MFSMSRTLIFHALTAPMMAVRDAPENRIAAGHPSYAAKGAGHHNKRRAKRFARTRGMNKTQARRR